MAESDEDDTSGIHHDSPGDDFSDENVSSNDFGGQSPHDYDFSNKSPHDYDFGSKSPHDYDFGGQSPHDDFGHRSPHDYDFGTEAGAAAAGSRGPGATATGGAGGSAAGGGTAPADDDPLALYRTEGRAPDPDADQNVESSPYDLLSDKNYGPVQHRVPLPKQSQPTFWTGLLVGVFTLCVLAGITVYYLGIGTKPPERRIVRAPVAGGLKLDAQSAPVFSRLLDPYKQLLEDISRGRIRSTNVITAVYDGGIDAASGQRKQILFVGSVGDLGNPRRVASEYRDLEKQRKNLKVIRVNPGRAGGEAFCLELRLPQAVGSTAAGCVWMTENTVGYIIPTVPAKADEVAATMRKMRPDLEKVEED